MGFQMRHHLCLTTICLWKICLCMVECESLSEFLIDIFFQTLGPLLPIPLESHSMVKLGKGQAILGGKSNIVYQSKIYSMSCSNRNCIISSLNRELSVSKGYFVAIPIPDKISGCITGGKKDFQKTSKAQYIQSIICFTLKYSMPVPKTDWRWSLSGLQQ